jgi:hypothetical protein
MPKLSLTKIAELAKTPSFFEGVRLTHGSYARASRATGISARTIAKLSARGKHEVSDKQLKSIQKGLSKMTRGNYEVANAYMHIKPVKWTKGQVEFSKQYVAKSEKARRYFRKAVREAYTKNIKHIRMPALDQATGKVFNPSPAKKRVRRGSKGRSRQRAIRRHGRRRN